MRGIRIVLWCFGLVMAVVPMRAWADFQAVTPGRPLPQAPTGGAMADWCATWATQTETLRREAGHCLAADSGSATASDNLPGCWRFVARHARAMSALWAGIPAFSIVVRYFDDLGRLAERCQSDGGTGCLDGGAALRAGADKKTADGLLDCSGGDPSFGKPR